MDAYRLMSEYPPAPPSKTTDRRETSQEPKRAIDRSSKPAEARQSTKVDLSLARRSAQPCCEITPKGSRVHLRSVGVALTVVAGALLAALGSSLAEGDSDPAPANGAPARRGQNRLSRETSPYLLSHAHNPVDWYPWGPEALEKAKKENKPIFLSIGYSSCHWCHVMEKKVFSDREIARYMNEHFINIKVDREERPDLDDVYMTSLQVYFQAIGSNQTGGWPLSIFLTPDGRPLAGGTYFPPEDENGRPGFTTLLKRVVEAWGDKRDQLERNADILAETVRNTLKTRVPLKPAELEFSFVESVVKNLAATYDKQYGGFGYSEQASDRPKFPVPTKLSLLQYETKRRNNEKAGEMLYQTLDKMAAGGIYDHVGGGFHRYSTDRFWRVPHFEKMLYDNAQLIDVYAEAYRHTNQKHYKDVVEETIEFVFRELRDAGGAFYAALDADSEGVEGKFYVWTNEQLQQVLSPEDLSICHAVYGTGKQQNFEVGHVIERETSIDAAAQSLKMPAIKLNQRRLEVNKKLLAARNQRRRPARDDKILVSWNGLMIRALAKAGVILQKPEYVQAAEKAANFLLTQLRTDDGKLLHGYAGGKARFNAYLDDYAYLVEGLLSLHLATNEDKWANAAQRLTDMQMSLFWDEEGKACFFTSHDHEKLLARTKNPYDSVLPSGNSVTVRNFLRLSAVGRQTQYRDKARESLELFTPLIEGAPGGMTNMALALAEFLDTTETADRRPRTRNSYAGISPDEGPAAPADVRLVSGNKKDDGKSAKKEKQALVTGEAFLSYDKLPPGKTSKVLIKLKLEKGWHIHANPPGDKELDTATEISLEESKLGIELTKLAYPKGKSAPRVPEGEPQSLYEDAVSVFGELVVPESAAGKTEEVVVKVFYQACNDKTCRAPTELEIKVPVKVAKKDEAVKAVNESLFAPAAPAKKKKTTAN